MTTKASERYPSQLWVDTSVAVIEKARQIAKEKRMTFSGFIGQAIEKAVEEENDESNSER